ncbi:MAG: InlB B-repeat-containing protein [Lachnospiraceae bacterium]|jgi:uncharacterized repeat protein (TIGR02543 family)|nr:InlB B-repeat-containing protein [Lachnospiraceae bacterium]
MKKSALVFLLCFVLVYGTSAKAEEIGIKRTDIDNSSSIIAEEKEEVTVSNDLRKDEQVTPIENEQYYTVTFMYDNKTEVKNVQRGDLVVPPEINVKQDEKAFWRDVETSYYYDFSKPIEKNLTLELVIEGIPENGPQPIPVKIILNVNGGNPLQASIWRGHRGDIIKSLPSPLRDGYNFIGWYDENGKKWVNGMKIRYNITLKACWQKIQPVQTNYDVSPKTADENNVMFYTLMLIFGAVAFGIVRIEIKSIK